MATTALRDRWTHDRRIDAPKSVAEIAGDLRFWLSRYRSLPEDAAARRALPPGYQDREGREDLIATQADLHRLLGMLTHDQRQALARCCICGESAGRAAEAMNTTRGAVRAAIKSGLRDAARILIGEECGQ